LPTEVPPPITQGIHELLHLFPFPSAAPTSSQPGYLTSKLLWFSNLFSITSAHPCRHPPPLPSFSSVAAGRPEFVRPSIINVSPGSASSKRPVGCRHSFGTFCAFLKRRRQHFISHFPLREAASPAPNSICPIFHIIIPPWSTSSNRQIACLLQFYMCLWERISIMLSLFLVKIDPTISASQMRGNPEAPWDRIWVPNSKIFSSIFLGRVFR